VLRSENQLLAGSRAGARKLAEALWRFGRTPESIDIHFNGLHSPTHAPDCCQGPRAERTRGVEVLEMGPTLNPTKIFSFFFEFLLGGKDSFLITQTIIFIRKYRHQCIALFALVSQKSLCIINFVFSGVISPKLIELMTP
jgi:hypothetical protein